MKEDLSKDNTDIWLHYKALTALKRPLNTVAQTRPSLHVCRKAVLQNPKLCKKYKVATMYDRVLCYKHYT